MSRSDGPANDHRRLRRGHAGVTISQFLRAQRFQPAALRVECKLWCWETSIPVVASDDGGRGTDADSRI